MWKLEPIISHLLFACQYLIIIFLDPAFLLGNRPEKVQAIFLFDHFRDCVPQNPKYRGGALKVLRPGVADA